MQILFNGQLLPEEKLQLPFSNRAFQYNDGFFETIIILNGQLRFWDDHQDRMQEAANALKLELPPLFTAPEFEEQLLELASNNNLRESGRLKLKVWRAGEGLYTPNSDEAAWMATVQPFQEPLFSPMRVGVCSGIKTNQSPLSFFKGPNAPVYVMAGIEKKETGFDDMIILNPQGLVSELISSNIFWYINGEVYTPALDTGCVNGILRRNILFNMETRGIETHHTHCGVEDLYEAEAVFSANVTGIRSISHLMDRSLHVSHDLIFDISNSLFK